MHLLACLHVILLVHVCRLSSLTLPSLPPSPPPRASLPHSFTPSPTSSLTLSHSSLTPSLTSLPHSFTPSLSVCPMHRVSVPRSSLLAPYKVRPHRRRSFDPTDSMGLSQVHHKMIACHSVPVVNMYMMKSGNGRNMSGDRGGGGRYFM